MSGGAVSVSRGSGGAMGSLARPLPGVPAERLPGCGTPLPGAVRMRQRLHGNAASRAARRPPPAPRSGQEAEPGSPSRPSSQQAGPGGRNLVGRGRGGGSSFFFLGMRGRPAFTSLSIWGREIMSVLCPCAVPLPLLPNSPGNHEQVLVRERPSLVKGHL